MSSSPRRLLTNDMSAEVQAQAQQTTQPWQTTVSEMKEERRNQGKGKTKKTK